MTAKTDLDKARMLVKRHRQGHLFGFWDDLNAAKRQNLLTQIRQLDFGKIDEWVADYVKNPAPSILPDHFDPAPSYTPVPSDKRQQEWYAAARDLGGKLISQGKVAAFVVAGGQGTRLGFDGPKGDFPVSPLKNKTLFRIFAETISAVSNRYRASPAWYVMTSPLNYGATCDIFRRENYYGLNPKNVLIFQQGTLPNFDFDGRILLADKDTIASSPDGHGGSLKALHDSGTLADMKKRGVEFISYWQVDNPMVNLFDPLFIGLHALDKAEMSSKAVVKTGPFEKVGNFCLVDGKVTVIEYSDLPNELAEKKNPDGSLVFDLGSIAIHLISVAFVERLNTHGFALPLHKAVKKIPYINERGERINPDKPNGIKLESFVFDALPLASKSIILQTERSEEFAPTKNAAGVDSAETTRQMMVARAASWLEYAGVVIPKRPDGSPDCLIEIAPGFALEKDDIKTKIKQIPKIKQGDTIYLG
jgi:UDP-N-acetylglucosamine/UDP-N-acetylgalactosamine diphosphorylase